ARTNLPRRSAELPGGRTPHATGRADPPRGTRPGRRPRHPRAPGLRHGRPRHRHPADHRTGQRLRPPHPLSRDPGGPHMPEYLTPGVYVEETSFRSRSIEGVPTSTFGMAGRTQYGPLPYSLPGLGPNGAQAGPKPTPTLLTSFTEYERAFGGLTIGAD